MLFPTFFLLTAIVMLLFAWIGASMRRSSVRSTARGLEDEIESLRLRLDA